MSQRLRYLESVYEIRKTISMNIPDFFCVDENHKVEAKWFFQENKWFVSRGPAVEDAYPQLSFAGVFNSYKPKTSFTSSENIKAGIESLERNKYSQLKEYYYQAHSIEETTQSDKVLAMAHCRSSTYGCGTLYVYRGMAIVMSYEGVLSIFKREPRVKVYDLTKKIGSRFEESLLALSEHFPNGVDVEFLLGIQSEVYLTQIRPISEANLKHFISFSQADIERYLTYTYGNALPQPIGQWCFTLHDFDTLVTQQLCLGDVQFRASDALLVNYDKHQLLDALRYCRKYDIKTLLVRHETNVANSHLQYICHEDPFLEQCLHFSCDLPQELHTKSVLVTSDGLNVDINYE